MTRASAFPLILAFTRAIPIFPYELIHNLPACEATPGRRILLCQSAAPVLKSEREHHVVATMTAHGGTSQ
jgi:hypothetical protein